MARITRWNPFQEIVDMQRQLDRVFDEVNHRIGERDWTPSGNWLALDLYDNDDTFVVEADLPGMDIDDINITLHENTLTITASNEREETTESTRSVLSERRYGHFQRSIRLPEVVKVDDVTADYTNGVLTLTLPKSETTKPRQIKLNNPILTNEN